MNRKPGRHAGGAKRDGMIPIVFALIIFVTGKAWVTPLILAVGKSSARWIEGMNEGAQTVLGGGVALAVISLLAAATYAVERRRRP